MIRIKVIVEGPTEESFVKNILAPTLWPQDIYLTPFVLGIPGHRGGNVNYARVRKDIIVQMKQDPASYCSTMFDLYALGAGFPGTPVAVHLKGAEKATRIEQGIRDDIQSAIPEFRPDIRIIPYIQVHEYEGLLFSDPAAFAAALGKSNLCPQFKKIRDDVMTPEDINDNPNTAPSKRIIGLYPSYDKIIDGTLAAQEVGLPSMLGECPHFRAWVQLIQSLHPLT